MLRYWQSIGVISQPGDDSYMANNVTEALASIQGRTAINHKFVSPHHNPLVCYARL